MGPDGNDASLASPEDFAERDQELDALFARARSYPPTPRQWERMLRAVRPAGDARGRRAWRIGVPLAAAAAALAMAVILFAPPAHRSAFALARVAEAMRAVSTVERRSNDGSVSWESPGRCFAVRPAPGGQYAYRDFLHETVATYEPDRGCIIISSCDAPRLTHGFTGACTLDALIQTAESWGHSFDERWERCDRVEGGRPIIELRSKQPESWMRAVTIDGRSARVLRAETEEGSSDYYYPDEMPRDLYDLGVPRDTPVIDGIAPPQVLALREQVRANARRGFGAYRLVSASQFETVRLITDGRRWHVDCMAMDQTRAYSLAELQARARQYDHMDTLVGEAVTIYILAGETEQAVCFDERDHVFQRTVRPKELAFGALYTLEARVNWGSNSEVFFGLWSDEQCEALGPDEHGWVGYRIRGQGNRVSRPYYRERWYDPAHGYTLCYLWGYEDPEAEWQFTARWRTEYEAYTAGPVKPPADAPARAGCWEVLEWAELRPGQWYPTASRTAGMDRAADGSWQRREPDSDDASSTRYQVLIATPLDSVDDEWFQLPAEWLAVPAHEFN
jgi:hypothetical protein